ncbi:MAG: 4'-phosphopantetheinyl transferase superfamily protein [Clostridia bacterium]|nr:4'-phosphopantetheinyl transferase superfamily protein [Clostridia bacterium]
MLKYVIKDISDITEEEYDLSFSYMSESRKEKSQRQRNPLAKKSTLAGEWLVRSLLCEITGRGADTFVIDADEKGKLYSHNADGLFFNISHSHGKVAVAVCDKEIGIDIETVHPVNLKLAKRVCTPDELIYIFGHLPQESGYDETENTGYIRRFLEIWTLKEAYLKCTGTGITSFDALILPDDNFEKIKIEDDGYIMHIVIREI